jgi:dipeptidase
MCDTLVAIEGGRVLFAKNSDRDPNEAQLLEWHPRRRVGAGARLRCTHIEIAQVRETHAVLLSRPFWMWGAEIGANEHGVVIGNEAVFTRQPYAATGLTGMDLLRLALERAATAREAVETIGALLETHGQGGGCGHEDRTFTYHNSFIVADPRGAFVVETAGRRWQVQAVMHAAAISNGLTLPGIAAERALLPTYVSSCRTRRATTLAAARTATTIADLIRALRSHGDTPAPRYRLLNGAMAAPCMHAGGLVASSQTTASWVAELSPARIAHWVTGTAAPCTSIFKPVDLHEPLDLGPPPTDHADDRSLWWRHERLHRRLVADPALLSPYVAARDALEASWLAAPPAPRDAFAQADTFLAGWTARVAIVRRRDTRPRHVRRYWSARDARAGL